jgi:hypothetical protein
VYISNGSRLLRLLGLGLHVPNLLELLGVVLETIKQTSWPDTEATSSALWIFSRKRASLALLLRGACSSDRQLDLPVLRPSAQDTLRL